MAGGGLLFCVLAPFALLGLLVMIQFRVALAHHGYHRLVLSWRHSGTLLWHSPWRTAAVAAGNILLPLLASLYGMAALVTRLGLPPVASYVLHGVNAVQCLLGVALMVRLFLQPYPR